MEIRPLTEVTDYTVSYSQTTPMWERPGLHQGAGNYSGSLEGEFEIIAKDGESLTVA